MHGVTDSMIGRLLKPDIVSMLRQKNYMELKESLCNLEPIDISETIEGLSVEERAVVFRLLPRALSADVFENLPFADQEELIISLSQDQVSSILNEMDPDDRTALLEELPGKVTRRLLGLLTPKERRVTTTLLGYPEDSIGRLMTPEYVAVQDDWTVEKVFQHIRETGRDKESFNILYVIDKQDKLTAFILLRTLIFADPKSIVRDIMDTKVIALPAYDDQETASEIMIRYDYSILPVVDSDNTLVGIVTADDIFDVVVEETTEDMHRMGGMEALEDPYFDVSIITLVRKRIGWLAMLFLGSTMTILVMEFFQKKLQFQLILFLPLIVSCGGNSGSQASMLMIRAIAVQDVTLWDWYRVLRRELVTAIILGGMLGSIAFMRVYLFPGVLGTYYLYVAASVAGAVLAVVLFGSLIGSMLPFILQGIGIDPALCSSPLVATLVDITGLVIYFLVANFIMPSEFFTFDQLTMNLLSCKLVV